MNLLFGNPGRMLKLELRFIKATQMQPGERDNPVPAKTRPGLHFGWVGAGRDHLALGPRNLSSRCQISHGTPYAQYPKRPGDNSPHLPFLLPGY